MRSSLLANCRMCDGICGWRNRSLYVWPTGKTPHGVSLGVSSLKPSNSNFCLLTKKLPSLHFYSKLLYILFIFTIVNVFQLYPHHPCQSLRSIKPSNQLCGIYSVGVITLDSFRTPGCFSFTKNNIIAWLHGGVVVVTLALRFLVRFLAFLCGVCMCILGFAPSALVLWWL